MCAWECRHLCNAYIVHNIRIINIAHSKFQSWCLSVCTNTRFGFIVFLCVVSMYTIICPYISEWLLFACMYIIVRHFYLYIYTLPCVCLDTHMRCLSLSVSVLPMLEDECLYMYIMHDRLYLYLCWPESPVLNLCSSYLLFGIVSQPLSGHSSTAASILAQQPDRRKGRISPPLIRLCPADDFPSTRKTGQSNAKH